MSKQQRLVFHPAFPKHGQAVFINHSICGLLGTSLLLCLILCLVKINGVCRRKCFLIFDNSLCQGGGHGHYR